MRFRFPPLYPDGVHDGLFGQIVHTTDLPTARVFTQLWREHGKGIYPAVEGRVHVRLGTVSFIRSFLFSFAFSFVTICSFVLTFPERVMGKRV